MGAVGFAVLYSLLSKRKVIFALKSLCINFHGTELRNLTGHQVPVSYFSVHEKDLRTFHRFCMGFVPVLRTEGIKERFTVTKLISFSLVSSLLLEIIGLNYWSLYYGHCP